MNASPYDWISTKVMMDTPQFPWYDSIWLTSYVRAKLYVAQHHPDKLEDFVAAFAPLRTEPNFHPTLVQDLFDDETRDQLRQLVATLERAELERHELFSFGRLIVHNHPVLTDLQKGLTARMSDWAGEAVEPCYNFLSLYNNLGVCEPHLDAPSAKWTLDYCIDQSGPWPIHFSDVIPWPEEWPHSADPDWSERLKRDPALNFTSYTLQENQALVFAGSSQWHYRDRIPSREKRNFCHLAFFHYIPKAADKLVDPEKWAGIFDLSALDDVIVRPRKFSDTEKTILPPFLRAAK
jgi:hypothetical protein